MTATSDWYLRFKAVQAEPGRCVDCGRPAVRPKLRCEKCGDKLRGKRSYRERNRDKIAAGQRSYRERNRDKIAAGQRSYYERNRDKIAAGKRERWLKSPPKCAECGAPLAYQGRGRPPVFCREHRHNRSTTHRRSE